MDEQPLVSETYADWFDGESASALRALVRIEGEFLVIAPEGQGRILWPLAEVRQVRGLAEWDDFILRRAGNSPARLVARQRQTRALIYGATNRHLKTREPFRNLGRLLMFGAGAVASVAVIIFLLVPLLASQLARVMPPAGEKALGTATLGQVRAVFGGGDEAPLQFCESASGVAALEKMFARVRTGATLPYEVELHVLESDMINAFALPGGIVVVMEGLLSAAETPEEVAAVLAHELGHVAARDPTREALRSAGSIGVLGLLFGDFAGGSLALVMMNQLINADYSQAAETRADAFALKQLTANGLPPAALATFFRRIEEDAGEVPGVLAHFASHPEMGDRIAAAEAAPAPATTEPVLTEDEWRDLQWICGF
jgi:beta-barrel assembly-enhancing protease